MYHTYGTRTPLSILFSLFFLTFASSIFSGAFGCTKAIKGGVAATMGDDGPFEGLCSGRFLVCFLGKIIIWIEFYM